MRLTRKPPRNPTQSKQTLLPSTIRLKPLQLTLTHPVPMRSCKAPPPQPHPLQNPHRRKSSNLPHRRPRIPHRRSPRIGWQRRERLEGQAHHPSPLTACNQRGRGTRYTHQSYYCVWWCASTYQQSVVVEGWAEEEGQGYRDLGGQQGSLGRVCCLSLSSLALWECCCDEPGRKMVVIMCRGAWDWRFRRCSRSVSVGSDGLVLVVLLSCFWLAGGCFFLLSGIWVTRYLM